MAEGSRVVGGVQLAYVHRQDAAKTIVELQVQDVVLVVIGLDPALRSVAVVIRVALPLSWNFKAVSWEERERQDSQAGTVGRKLFDTTTHPSILASR
jgi:hypothetical protein